MALTFDQFVARAKALRGKTEDTLIEFYLFLLDMHHATDVWRARYATWDSLLVGEHISTPTRFHDVKTFVERYGRAKLHTLGVSSASAVLKAAAALRDEICEEAVLWATVNKHRPPRNVVVNLISKRRPPTATSSIREDGPALKRHIRRLEGILASKGVKAPPIEGGEIQITALDAASMLVRARFKLKSFYPSLSDQDLVALADQLVSASALALETALRVGNRSIRGNRVVRVSTAEGDRTIEDALLEALAELRRGTALELKAYFEKRSWIVQLLPAEAAIRSALLDNPKRFKRVGSIGHGQAREALYAV